MAKGSKYPDEMKRAAAIDYADGMTSAMVGEKYGVGHSTVLVWAKKFGIPVNPRFESPNVLEDGRWVQDGYIQRWVS